MGNTIEMSQLKVNDVMIPRNQVQILMLKIPFQLTLKLQNHVVTQGCLYVMMIWIDAWELSMLNMLFVNLMIIVIVLILGK